MAGEGVATLGAVAELVINLSIAQRSHLIYGRDHEVARRTADHAEAALGRALALLQPIVIRFTPAAVFLGGQSLGAHHPIYRNFAERVWRLGIAGITFQAGAARDGVVGLVLAINEATRHHATREQAEAILRAAGLERIDVHFLRQLLTHEVRDEVQSLAPDEARRQWEELMAQLALLSGPLPRLEERGDGDRPRERADYAGAVIDYLRHVQHVQQQEAALQATEFGQRVSDLIANLNPELRRQIAGAALATPDVTVEALQGFVNLVGQDALLETVRRLNRSGQSIPASAFRALSMLAMTQRENAGPSQAAGVAGALDIQPAAAMAPLRSGEELQTLLDGLMHDEPSEAYTTEEYTHLLRDAEQYAQRMVLLRKGRPVEVPLAADEGEHHFALVASQILRDNAADRPLAATICREAQKSCVRLLEAASPRGWLDAMKLARAAALEAEVEPEWAWEQDEVLEVLRERLTGAGRWLAEASVDQLVAVGGKAAPLLVEVLATSDSLSVRRRALAGLVGLSASPTAVLLPLLDAHQPWYLQRNAVYVLRERRDPAGAELAKDLWRRAEPRVRTEIVGYLLAISDADRLRFLDEALQQTEPAQALQVARAVLKQPTRETIMAVVRRAERVPPDLVGAPFHMGLLVALAGTRQPQALHYVAELPARRQPVLPWQRGRYRSEIEAMVKGSPPPPATGLASEIRE